MSVEKFELDFLQSDVEDLHNKINNVRWPNLSPGNNWEDGTDQNYLQELIAYWTSDFDWSEQVRYLNTFNHYTTLIDGYRIHFLHHRNKNPDSTPLILTHGWPGTFYEMLPLIPLLTQTEEGFDVIIPSIPGFTFSSDPGEHPVDAAVTAQLWDKLMTILEYDRYGAYGSDWGSLVTRHLSEQFPDRLIGIHTPGTPPITKDAVLPEEKNYIENRNYWMIEETGYQRIHGTKPQTLAYGLTDSPVGLAAWIVEKLRAWSDCNGDLEMRFSKDQILTLVSLYCFTGCINSSMRYYHANGLGNSRSSKIANINESPNVPRSYSGFAGIPGMGKAPKSMIEPAQNVIQWTDYETGGHFPGIEEPTLLAKDIETFFKAVRS